MLHVILKNARFLLCPGLCSQLSSEITLQTACTPPATSSSQLSLPNHHQPLHLLFLLPVLALQKKNTRLLYYFTAFQITQLLRGGADIKIWFPNWFLIWSIKKAEANCWVKEKVELLGLRRKRRDERKEEVFSARLWNGRQATDSVQSGRQESTINLGMSDRSRSVIKV